MDPSKRFSQRQGLGYQAKKAGHPFPPSSLKGCQLPAGGPPPPPPGVLLLQLGQGGVNGWDALTMGAGRDPARSPSQFLALAFTAGPPRLPRTAGGPGRPAQQPGGLAPGPLPGPAARPAKRPQPGPRGQLNGEQTLNPRPSTGGGRGSGSCQGRRRVWGPPPLPCTTGGQLTIT